MQCNILYIVSINTRPVSTATVHIPAPVAVHLSDVPREVIELLHSGGHDRGGCHLLPGRVDLHVIRGEVTDKAGTLALTLPVHLVLFFSHLQQIYCSIIRITSRNTRCRTVK